MKILFSSKTLFLLSALFILYGTTIPWDFTRAPSLERFAWFPGRDDTTGRGFSIPDVIQNVALFIPFGFFGFLAAARTRRHAFAVGMILVGLASLFSLFVELLQTMSEERTPSAWDVLTNTLGAFAGVVGAAVDRLWIHASFSRLVRATARTHPGLLILVGYLLALSAGALAPFIPTLDVSALRAAVRGLLEDPIGDKPIGALVPDVIRFAAIAFLAGQELMPWLLERYGRPASFMASMVGAVCFPVAWAITLEGMQLFVIDHVPALIDVGAALVGALVGAAALLLCWPRARPDARLGDLTRRAPRLVLGFSIALPAARALEPFAFVPVQEKIAAISVWQLVPFWMLLRNVNLASIRNVFDAGIHYVPLGYALSVLGRRTIFVFAAAVALAELLELLQLPIAERSFDVTEGIYAGLCALAGAQVLTALGDALGLDAPRGFEATRRKGFEGRREA